MKWGFIRLRVRQAESTSRGMVTAELATIVPFVVVMGLICLWIVSMGLTQVRLTDAAREAARLVARGETTQTATEAASQLAPEATVEIETSGSVVSVRVSQRGSFQLPGLNRLTSPDLRATSVAVLEAP